MLFKPSIDVLRQHLDGLRRLEKETEWVEFKHNPDWMKLGKYISALANSAALCDKDSAFLVYGIDDNTHDVVGTNQKFSTAKHQGQEVESWLNQKIDPKCLFQVYEFETRDGLPVMLVEIEAAKHVPIKFDGDEWIRVGSYTKRLREFPEKERALWRSFDRKSFELHLAMSNVPPEQVVSLLSAESYFDMMGRPMPETRAGILDVLASDGIVKRDVSGLYGITNLGAVCFAKKLSHFPALGRKIVRIIRYRDDKRLVADQEVNWDCGYAVDFEGLVRQVVTLLPSYEEIGVAYRRVVSKYPPLAVRELVANALIHQDFSMTGSNPMIEIFSNRIEVSNPGEPLVEPRRFLDSPPRSRNEALAALMRRMDICEERGSGIDKVVASAEETFLPAPQFEVTSAIVRATLFGYKAFRELSPDEKKQICYYHCCLRYVNKESMTNASLRQRLGVETKNSAAVSRMIKDAVLDGLIKPLDPNAGPRSMRYVPFWA